jgi:hypothetical protein
MLALAVRDQPGTDPLAGTKHTWQPFLLLQILLALKRVITDEQLFDPQNPTIIMCDRALEEALEVKGLHISELR